ncbi:hypothetical protein Ocin01_18699 [Orchesella cincta]|uniref:F-box domain-containing protein n=1 Tax=Orchesella cincta TaxID=48709 RepID=A0A1D2M4Y6_ORCCI|nr:hypothetical protein Ocin01_18699 [Orchesella cincta]
MSTFSSSFVLCSENEDSTMEISSTSSPRALEPPTNDYDYSEVPPEVWKEILHKIEDPLTFQNCSKVSSEFCEILRPERTSQLFSLVLPFINDQLSLKDLLSCRQACKRWKNGVDNHLPLDPSWKIRRNPFPTRTVLLYNLATPDANRNGVRLEVQDTEELFTAFRSLLRKFGDQIHTFVFVTDHNDHLQACIQQIIKLLPNLKKLRLEVLNNDPWGLQVFNEGWDWFKHLNSSLISLHVGPFYSSKVTGSILEAIGSQLEYLGCEATTIQELIYFGSPTHPWFIREIPNLRELNITRIDMSRSDNELLILQRLARLRLPKLERLFYNADQNAMQGEISLKTVLQLINQFAPTLENSSNHGFKRMIRMRFLVWKIQRLWPFLVFLFRS